MNAQLKNPSKPSGQAKGDVLGQVSQPKIEGVFEIPEEKLKEPLYYDGTVVRCFCFGCGTSTELLPEGAIHLAKKAKVDVPLLWKGFYFVSEKCVTCANDYKKVIMKMIP